MTDANVYLSLGLEVSTGIIAVSFDLKITKGKQWEQYLKIGVLVMDKIKRAGCNPVGCVG